jgi:hypothetical protein
MIGEEPYWQMCSLFFQKKIVTSSLVSYYMMHKPKTTTNTSTLAPALSRRLSSLGWSRYAAHMTGLLPALSVAFTSARLCRQNDIKKKHSLFSLLSPQMIKTMKQEEKDSFSRYEKARNHFIAQMGRKIVFPNSLHQPTVQFASIAKPGQIIQKCKAQSLIFFTLSSRAPYFFSIVGFE